MAEAIHVERPKLGKYVSATNKLRILRRKDGKRKLQQFVVTTDMDADEGSQIIEQWIDVPEEQE